MRVSRLRLVAVALGAAVLSGAVASPTQAATGSRFTIHILNNHCALKPAQEFNPQGDTPDLLAPATVTLVNDDTCTHTLNGAFAGQLAQGSTFIATFTTPGRTRYYDVKAKKAGSRSAEGWVVVVAAPSPSPTASPKPSVTASPRPRPTASPTPRPSATASPTPTPTHASPTPTPTPTPSATPTASASSAVTPSPGSTPVVFGSPTDPSSQKVGSTDWWTLLLTVLAGGVAVLIATGVVARRIRDRGQAPRR